MIVIGRPGRGHVIGIAQLRAHALEQAAMKPPPRMSAISSRAAKSFIAKLAAQMPERQKGLCDIRFRGDEDARRRFAVTGGNGGTGGCLTVQSANRFSSLAFISAIEKSPIQRASRSPGRNSVIELHHVGPRNAIDGGVLHLPAIRCVPAVNDAVELPLRDGVRLIVPP